MAAAVEGEERKMKGSGGNWVKSKLSKSKDTKSRNAESVPTCRSSLLLDLCCSYLRPPTQSPGKISGYFMGMSQAMDPMEGPLV